MTVYPNTTRTAAISPEVKENIEQLSYSDDRDSKSSQNKEVKAMFSDGSQSSKQQEEKPMMVVYPTTGKGMSSALKRMENQPLGLSNNDNRATQENIKGTAKPIKCLNQSSEQEDKKPRMVVHPYTRKSLIQEINDNDEKMLQCSSDGEGIATENNQETNWNMRKVNDNIYYDIDTELGRGASSTVFKGTFRGCHKHTKGFPIAVKRVSFKTKHDAKTTEREQTHLELKMIEKLEPHRHKNIVGFYGSHITNGKLFLAFELCQGTLCDYVTNDELFVHLKTLLKPVQVNKEISCGLSYMHSNGIAHRDLKPANILFVLHDDARVVIGDFGSATAVDENVASSFDTSGTLGFIAPETYQAFCNSGSDSMTLLAKKSDVFSLGLLFYFCVTSGKHPYGGNPMESQKNISDGILPNLNELEKKHYALKDMLENMFAYNPNDRPNAYDVEIHPALWEPKRIMEYFVDRSDTFEEFIKLTPGQKSMLEDTYLLPNGNWMRNMPEKLKNHLKHYKYDGRYMYEGKGNSARFLLRTIRNIDSHFRGFPEDVRAVLGKKYPDDHVNFWLGICPKFLLHVHKVLNRISLSS